MAAEDAAAAGLTVLAAAGMAGMAGAPGGAPALDAAAAAAPAARGAKRLMGGWRRDSAKAGLRVPTVLG
jgi:hypothetical protein